MHRPRGRQHADHYDWLSSYLYSQGWGTATRVMIGVMSASLTLNMVGLWISVDRPDGAIPITMTAVAFVGGVATALLWATRWPTRRQSIAFVVVCNVSVAFTSLAVDNPLAALIGCVAFALVGAYAAFFHGMALVAYNFAVAMIVCSFEAVRLAATGHAMLAVLDLWVIVVVNVALPVAIGFLVKALGIDLLGADRDPLTGLLNRRAFRRTVHGLVTARRSETASLVVIISGGHRHRSRRLQEGQRHLRPRGR